MVSPVKFDGLAPRREMRTAYIDHCCQQIINCILAVTLAGTAQYPWVLQGTVGTVGTAGYWVLWVLQVCTAGYCRVLQGTAGST